MDNVLPFPAKQGGHLHETWVDVGDFVKVQLGGERVWGIVQGLDEWAMMVVKLDNDPINPSYKKGQLVPVMMADIGGVLQWCPV